MVREGVCVTRDVCICPPLSGELQHITDTIQFSLVSSSPVQFTLTCTSTGGPATSVTWTRDGVNVTYDSAHVLTQTVVDTGRSAQYNNTLTVTVLEGGRYQCTVSNVISTVQSPVLSGPGKKLITFGSGGIMAYQSTIHFHAL